MNCIYVCGDNPNEYEKCFLIESSTRYKDKAIEEIGVFVSDRKNAEREE